VVPNFRWTTDKQVQLLAELANALEPYVRDAEFPKDIPNVPSTESPKF